jgi:hypothetical protein
MQSMQLTSHDRICNGNTYYEHGIILIRYVKVVERQKGLTMYVNG